MVNVWGSTERRTYLRQIRHGRNQVNDFNPLIWFYDMASLIALGLVGTGFATFRLPPPLNSVSLGICMDLNVQKPFEWESNEGPYEIASYCVAENSNLLILLNAWLESPEDVGEEHAWTTMNFWAHRLRPLWEQREGVSPDDHHGINVVVCNRTGNENGESHASSSCGGTGVVRYPGIKFCGSSCIFRMNNSGDPRLKRAMGKDEEGVSVWTV